MKNKMLAYVWLDSGCSQEKDEASVSWAPINFQIYDTLFIDLINEAAANWLAENKIQDGQQYEIIFQHEIERDCGGAVLAESFVPILVEDGALAS